MCVKIINMHKYIYVVSSVRYKIIKELSHHIITEAMSFAWDALYETVKRCIK